MSNEQIIMLSGAVFILFLIGLWVGRRQGWEKAMKLTTPLMNQSVIMGIEMTLRSAARAHHIKILEQKLDEAGIPYPKLDLTRSLIRQEGEPEQGEQAS